MAAADATDGSLLMPPPEDQLPVASRMPSDHMHEIGDEPPTIAPQPSGGITLELPPQQATEPERAEAPVCAPPPVRSAETPTQVHPLTRQLSMTTVMDAVRELVRHDSVRAQLSDLFHMSSSPSSSRRPSDPAAKREPVRAKRPLWLTVVFIVLIAIASSFTTWSLAQLVEFDLDSAPAEVALAGTAKPLNRPLPRIPKLRRKRKPMKQEVRKWVPLAYAVGGSLVATLVSRAVPKPLKRVASTAGTMVSAEIVPLPLPKHPVRRVLVRIVNAVRPHMPHGTVEYLLVAFNMLVFVGVTRLLAFLRSDDFRTVRRPARCTGCSASAAWRRRTHPARGLISPPLSPATRRPVAGSRHCDADPRSHQSAQGIPAAARQVVARSAPPRARATPTATALVASKSTADRSKEGDTSWCARRSRCAEGYSSSVVAVSVLTTWHEMPRMSRRGSSPRSPRCPPQAAALPVTRTYEFQSYSCCYHYQSYIGPRRAALASSGTTEYDSLTWGEYGESFGLEL